MVLALYAIFKDELLKVAFFVRFEDLLFAVTSTSTCTRTLTVTLGVYNASSLLHYWNRLHPMFFVHYAQNG